MTKTQLKELEELRAKIPTKQLTKRRRRIDGIIDTSKPSLNDVLNRVPMKNIRCDVSLDTYKQLLTLAFESKPEWFKLHTYCEMVLTEHAKGNLVFKQTRSKKMKG